MNAKANIYINKDDIIHKNKGSTKMMYTHLKLKSNKDDNIHTHLKSYLTVIGIIIQNLESIGQL